MLSCTCGFLVQEETNSIFRIQVLNMNVYRKLMCTLNLTEGDVTTKLVTDPDLIRDCAIITGGAGGWKMRGGA